MSILTITTTNRQAIEYLKIPFLDHEDVRLLGAFWHIVSMTKECDNTNSHTFILELKNAK